MTRALLIVAAIGAALAAGGACTKHQTEVILGIATEGVRIPEDVRSLNILVRDKNANAETWNQTIALCTATLTKNCYDLPLTAVLYPGPHGSDTVRVEIQALGPNSSMPVIDNAATFMFADEQSLRLDLVLYGNCLNTDCAARDLSCGPRGDCIDVKPTPANMPVDLAFSELDMSNPGCGKIGMPCCHPAPTMSRRGPRPQMFPDSGAPPPGGDMAMLPPGPDMTMLPPGPDMTMLPPGPDMTMLPPEPDMTMLPPEPDMTMLASPDLAQAPSPDDMAQQPPPPDLATPGPPGTCDPGLTCNPMGVCQ